MKTELGLSKNIEKLHQMFGKKLYSNKYSFISEICQNAVDSHRMSGQSKPVTVGISNTRFYVRDYGLSFTNKEDFIQKVCTILESGKSASKDSSEDCPMGMHGIGSISVSAYNSKWEYRVYMADGREFDCFLEEIEGRGLTYEMSDYRPSSMKEKGVLFSVGLQPGTIPTLVDAMKDKLSYFKDIKFEFSSDITRLNPKLITLNTEFKLYQGDDFQYSTLNRIDELHICLDQYSYRIRWDILGKAPIKIPVGLKFTMADGLEADITRENLICDENYKKIVTDKIEKVCSDLITRYNTQAMVEYEDIHEFRNAYASPISLKIASHVININDAKMYSKVKTNEILLKGISDIHLAYKFCMKSNYGKDFYDLTSHITKGGTRTKSPASWYRFTHDNTFLEDVPITNKNIGYLREHYKNSGYYTIKKLKAFKGPHSYRHILDLPSLTQCKEMYKKKGINPIISIRKDIETLLEYTEKFYFKKLSSISIPVIKKKRTVRAKVEDEYCIQYGRIALAGDSPVYDASYIKECDLPSKMFTIYDVKDKKFQLDKLYRYFRASEKWHKVIFPFAHVAMVSEKVYASLNKLNLTNFMTLDEFLKGQSEPYKKLVSGIKVTRLINKHSSIFNATSFSLIKTYISDKLGTKMENIYKYATNINMANITSGDAFLNSIVALGEVLKLKDDTIEDDYLYVKENICKIDFINVVSLNVFTHGSNESRITVKKLIDDLKEQRKIE